MGNALRERVEELEAMELEVNNAILAYEEQLDHLECNIIEEKRVRERLLELAQKKRETARKRKPISAVSWQEVAQFWDQKSVQL